MANSTNELIYSIRDYDIMQHIRNIYSILGFQSLDGIIGGGSIAEIISYLRANQKNYWVGTLAQYEEGRGNGLIGDDILCIITDDYVPVPGNK